MRRLRTLVRLLLLSPPLSHVNPSNSRGLFQGLAAWLFVPATQTQFAFRPLSFLHDTLLRPSPVVVYVSSCFLLFFGSKRISNFLFPWKRYSTLDEYPKHRMQRREKELEIRLPIIPTRSSKLWKNNFSQIPPSIQLSNILRSFPRDP